jgi:hypothetical protein
VLFELLALPAFFHGRGKPAADMQYGAKDDHSHQRTGSVYAYVNQRTGPSLYKSLVELVCAREQR